MLGENKTLHNTQTPLAPSPSDQLSAHDLEVLQLMNSLPNILSPKEVSFPLLSIT